MLITGMTPMQCGSPGTLGICNFPAMVAQALMEAGHEVEHRPAMVGEDLGGFDWALVGLASPIAVTSNYALPAMDVIGRARAAGCELAFYLDDWRVRNVHTNFGCVVKNPPMLVRPIFDKRPGAAWAKENLEYLAGLAHHIQGTPWPITILPMFPWGNPQILLDTTSAMKSLQFVFVDPSACVPPTEPLRPPVRERKWLSGALTSNEKWLAAQGFTWPVEEYGHRSKGQPRITEAELAARYGAAWGVVASPYFHAGSGWWRVRYIHAARARAVLFADPAEVAGLGPAYRHPLAELEAMSDNELRDVAEAQAADLLGRQWSRDRLREALDALVRGELGEPSTDLGQVAS